MAEISTYRNMVQPKSVDCTRRASVAAIIGYMLDVAGEDADRKGFGISALDSASTTWVLSRLAVDITAQPKQYEEIAIDTWVNEFNRLSSTRNFRVRRGEECVAAGVSQWCMLDFDTRMPVDMNTLQKVHDGTIVDAPSPCERPRRLGAVVGEPITEHKVVYSDIDFNRHMNTMRYIDLIFDSMPIEVPEKLEAWRMDVNFMREALYGDMLSLKHSDADGVKAYEFNNAAGEALCRFAFEFK